MKRRTLSLGDFFCNNVQISFAGQVSPDDSLFFQHYSLASEILGSLSTLWNRNFRLLKILDFFIAFQTPNQVKRIGVTVFVIFIFS